MLRKALVILAVGLLPAVAQAQFHAGDKELTLGGTGANGNEFNGVTAAANGSLGYFFTDQLELSVRQSVSYTDLGARSLNGSTRVAADFHFDLGTLVPYIGANIGFVYGDSVNDTWEAAPEAGLKWFVNSTTFIFGQAEYQFFFDKGSKVGDSFSDGQFVYSLGIGFRF